MNHVSRVNVLERADHLQDVVGGAWLRVAAAWLGKHVLVKLAFGAVLKNQVNFLLIVEKSVKLEHVFVPQVTLDLDFTPQLVGNLGLLKLTLVEHLE